MFCLFTGDLLVLIVRGFTVAWDSLVVALLLRVCVCISSLFVLFAACLFVVCFDLFFLLILLMVYLLWCLRFCVGFAWFGVYVIAICLFC